MGLSGNYRGTATEVNPDDVIGRERAIIALNQVFGWNLKSNKTQFKIDLLHIGRRGGVDVEEGKWFGRYRDQDFENFNQYTIPCPTANFPYRKEKYFNEYYDWITDMGNLKTYHHPDYEYNSMIRFNYDFTEFFFVDYEKYKKRIEKLGYWATHTVFKTDTITGQKTPEYWLCWELKDVDFYVLENGVYVKDTYFEDKNNYDEYLAKYQKAYEQKKNKK